MATSEIYNSDYRGHKLWFMPRIKKKEQQQKKWRAATNQSVDYRKEKIGVLGMPQIFM